MGLVLAYFTFSGKNPVLKVEFNMCERMSEIGHDFNTFELIPYKSEENKLLKL